MTRTLFGPDGALYQEGIKLTQADWNAVDYVAWRVIHQDGRPDRSYAPMRDRAKANSKPFVAYVWVDAMDPNRKADFVVKAVADPSIPIMVDWEDRSCPYMRMRQFVMAMRARGYRVTLLYTGRSFWQEMGQPVLVPLGVELVVARYGDQKPAGMYESKERYEAMLPRYGVWNWDLGGLKPSMWQFGSRVRWGDRYMDMNAIRDPGVITRCFKSWTGPPPPPQPPAPPEDEMLLTSTELDLVWDAPGADAAKTEDRWLTVCIAKCGPIADVQRRNGLKATGRYDQATALAYDAELAAMRATTP